MPKFKRLAKITQINKGICKIPASLFILKKEKIIFIITININKIQIYAKKYKLNRKNMILQQKLKNN